MSQQFESLRASELYCPKCKTAQPVREKLLLVLPHAELHDYCCTRCGTSLGSREVKAPPLTAATARPQPAARSGQRAPRGALPGRRQRR
jgi:hypothetical protein